jgi:hypothetical protein
MEEPSKNTGLSSERIAMCAIQPLQHPKASRFGSVSSAQRRLRSTYLGAEAEAFFVDTLRCASSCPMASA